MPPCKQGGDAALLRLPSGGGWRLRADAARMTIEESVYLGGPAARRTVAVVLSGDADGAQNVKWAITRVEEAPNAATRDATAANTPAATAARLSGFAVARTRRRWLHRLSTPKGVGMCSGNQLRRTTTKLCRHETSVLPERSPFCRFRRYRQIPGALSVEDTSMSFVRRARFTFEPTHRMLAATLMGAALLAGPISPAMAQARREPCLHGSGCHPCGPRRQPRGDGGPAHRDAAWRIEDYPGRRNRLAGGGANHARQRGQHDEAGGQPSRTCRRAR